MIKKLLGCVLHRLPTGHIIPILPCLLPTGKLFSKWALVALKTVISNSRKPKRRKNLSAECWWSGQTPTKGSTSRRRPSTLRCASSKKRKLSAADTTSSGSTAPTGSPSRCSPSCRRSPTRHTITGRSELRFGCYQWFTMLNVWIGIAEIHCS